VYILHLHVSLDVIVIFVICLSLADLFADDRGLNILHIIPGLKIRDPIAYCLAAPLIGEN
jgi:hypothetical protein